MQLMDTDGTMVQRFPPREEHWTLRASLGDLACISSGHNRLVTLVVDLSTGKVLLPCLKPAEDGVAGILLYSSCGRAAQSGSLKFFRLVLPLRGEDTQLICKVFTLGDGAEWRLVQSPPTMVSHSYNNSSSSGVTVNGALHFLSEGHYDVLSFDLNNEKWKVIRGPPAGFVGSRKTISIAELNGTVCRAQILQPLVADIWLLRDSEKNFWTKAYAEFVVPLRVLRLGGELLFYYYDHRSKPVLEVYDPRSGKCTNVKTSTNLIGRIGLCNSNLDPRFSGQS